MTLKEVLRLMVPPLFLHLVRRPWTGRKPFLEWEYIPEGWAYAKTHPEVKGWNVVDVLKTYKQKWPRFVDMVQGKGPLGVVHESDMTTNEDILSHNTTMAFAYTLVLTAHKKDQLSILDWGGGLGHYYLLAKTLLPIVEIEYHCKDVPVLCEYGAQLFPQHHFYSDEQCLNRTYDFVLASTSLHYAENWQSLLQRLADATRGYLYIANLPSVQKAASFVFAQRPYQYGYNTEYLAWCLNQTEFLCTARSAGLQLIREFVYGHCPVIHGAPEQNVYRGYLFRADTEEAI